MIVVWNDYLGPLVYISDSEKFTLPIGLSLFKGAYTVDYTSIMAITVLMTLPTMAAFFIQQKQILQIQHLLHLPFLLLPFDSGSRVIPRDFEESAIIDGANHWQIFTKIFIPLMKPQLFLSGIMIPVYNDAFPALHPQ